MAGAVASNSARWRLRGRQGGDRGGRQVDGAGGMFEETSAYILGFPRRRRGPPPLPPPPGAGGRAPAPPPPPLLPRTPRVASPSEATRGSPSLPSPSSPPPLIPSRRRRCRPPGLARVMPAAAAPFFSSPRGVVARAMAPAAVHPGRRRIRWRLVFAGGAAPGGEVAVAWLLGCGAARWLAAEPFRPRSGPFWAPSGSGWAWRVLFGVISGRRRCGLGWGWRRRWRVYCSAATGASRARFGLGRAGVPGLLLSYVRSVTAEGGGGCPLPRGR
nr:translation initiation factor IF-2-like [Aegilops tauschii subsp. strangulata]